MSEIEIDNGETEKIIPHDQADRTYICEVYGSDVRIGHSERYARNGTTLEAEQQHKLGNLRGEQLFAHAHDGPARLRLNHAAADVESNPSREVRVIDGEITATLGTNQDDFRTQTVTGSGSFDFDEVPDGVTVLYRADPGNNDTVYLDGFPVSAGDTIGLDVTSVGAVTISANDGTDETHAIYEVSD